MLAELFLSACIILVFDQVTKKLSLHRLTTVLRSPAGSRPRIRPIGSVRIGLGLVRDTRVLVLIWSVAVMGTILLAKHIAPLQGHVPQIGLGAAIGGATGNLLDMLWRGAVIDFIDLRIGPVFNIADTAIILGVAAAFRCL